jgi:ribonuclease BN (tRNA processing enzyme)
VSPQPNASTLTVTVLGCSGAIAAGCKTTAFLLDDDILVDAGTGVGDMTLQALALIEHIFISHSHLDHILSIGLLADTVMRTRRAQGRGPIQVHALPETLAALRLHIFNGVIWPDFTRLPSTDHPVLELIPFAVGDVLQLGQRRIEVLTASHTVPAVGFAASLSLAEVSASPFPSLGASPPEGAKSSLERPGDQLKSGLAVQPFDAAPHWVFTGDTGPNPLLWQRLNQIKVSQLVIETAFSDDERQLAYISRHLCPAALGHELTLLGGSVDVYITHIKPGESDAVMAEIAKLKLPHRIHPLVCGQKMQLISP